MGRFETGRYRNRSGPVTPVTAVSGPVPVGFFNPGREGQGRQVYSRAAVGKAFTAAATSRGGTLDGLGAPWARLSAAAEILLMAVNGGP